VNDDGDPDAIDAIELASNIGIWAPPGTPREVVQKLNLEAAAALKNLPPDVSVSDGIKLALKSLAR